MQWQIQDNWRYSNKALPASWKSILPDFCSYQVAISSSKTNMIIIEQNNVTMFVVWKLVLAVHFQLVQFLQTETKKMVLVILFSLTNRG